MAGEAFGSTVALCCPQVDIVFAVGWWLVIWILDAWMRSIPRGLMKIDDWFSPRIQYFQYLVNLGQTIWLSNGARW